MRSVIFHAAIALLLLTGPCFGAQPAAGSKTTAAKNGTGKTAGAKMTPPQCIKFIGDLNKQISTLARQLEACNATNKPAKECAVIRLKLNRAIQTLKSVTRACSFGQRLESSAFAGVKSLSDKINGIDLKNVKSDALSNLGTLSDKTQQSLNDSQLPAALSAATQAAKAAVDDPTAKSLWDRFVARMAEAGRSLLGIGTKKNTSNDLKDYDPAIEPVKAQGLPPPGAVAGYPEISEPTRDTEGPPSSSSEKGAELIAKFEGSVRNSEGKHIIYYDQGGLPTIGYGHLITDPVEKAEYRNGITEFQALALFKGDIERFENGVRNGLTVKVNQAQFDALVSLAYNIGLGAFSNSELLRLINARADISEIGAEWRSWNKVTIGGVKQVSQGLKNRRELEWRLYSTGKY